MDVFDAPKNAKRRAVFLSSDDESVTATVAALAEQLGYAPVNLDRIAEGGQLAQARKASGGRFFRDLFKKTS